MKIEKLSLNGIKNALSRAELKKIMAGSGPGCGGTGGIPCCQCGNPCTNGETNFHCISGLAVSNCSDYCRCAGYSIGLNDCPLNCASLAGCNH